jgi:hypothetical protein
MVEGERIESLQSEVEEAEERSPDPSVICESVNTCWLRQHWLV